VLASEDSSASEPGEAGLLSTCSSGVGGTDESGESDMVGSLGDSHAEVRLQRSFWQGYLVVSGMRRLLGNVEMALQAVATGSILSPRD
jgi:hypothetical protein